MRFHKRVHLTTSQNWFHTFRRVTGVFSTWISNIWHFEQIFLITNNPNSQRISSNSMYNTTTGYERSAYERCRINFIFSLSVSDLQIQIYRRFSPNTLNRYLSLCNLTSQRVSSKCMRNACTYTHTRASKLISRFPSVIFKYRISPFSKYFETLQTDILHYAI